MNQPTAENLINKVNWIELNYYFFNNLISKDCTTNCSRISSTISSIRARILLELPQVSLLKFFEELLQEFSWRFFRECFNHLQDFSMNPFKESFWNASKDFSRKSSNNFQEILAIFFQEFFEVIIRKFFQDSWGKSSKTPSEMLLGNL